MMLPPDFLKVLDTPAPVSLRLHPSGADFYFPTEESIPWCPTGRFLPLRPSFTLDPLFHAGTYYVQEASSMFLWQLGPFLQQLSVEVSRGLRVLDLCAAPGGKSTLLADIIPAGSLLVANEVIRSRVPVLMENLSKWGCSRSVVTQNDPADFASLKGFFDVILVDAPCSGEGMFRKDPASREQWSPDAVQLCASRQRRILSDVIPALSPGGLLVYSTCTFNHFEDEDQVCWMEQTFGLKAFLPISEENYQAWGLKGNSTREDCMKFIPGRQKGEGFFCAVLKNGDSTEPGSAKRREKGERCEKVDKSRDKQKQKVSAIPQWIVGEWEYKMKGELLKAYPADLYNVMVFLESKLRVAASGLAMAQVKGRDWLPVQDIAQCRNLRQDAFPREEVSLETALQYLRREAIVLEKNTPEGYVLICFGGAPLGFVKNIGSRSNNLYPPARRIMLRY